MFVAKIKKISERNKKNDIFFINYLPVGGIKKIKE
jgi:hypothetical protein